MNRPIRLRFPGRFTLRIFHCLRELERDLDDHIFLPADCFAPAHLHQNLARVDSEFFRGALSMPQEAGIDPSVAEGQRRAIDSRGLLHDRRHEFFGDVH